MKQMGLRFLITFFGPGLGPCILFFFFKCFFLHTYLVQQQRMYLLLFILPNENYEERKKITIRLLVEKILVNMEFTHKENKILQEFCGVVARSLFVWSIGISLVIGLDILENKCIKCESYC